MPDNRSWLELLNIDRLATYTSEERYAMIEGIFRSSNIEPSEAPVYSNAGYALLGLIIEEASGMPYGDYLEEVFFKPLGLTATGHCTPEPEGLATGYRAEGGDFIPIEFESPTLSLGFGSLCSSGRDLIVWEHALSHGIVLEPTHWYAMITGTPHPLYKTAAYGYGVEIELDSVGGEMIAYGHSGVIPGYSSNLRHLVDQNLTIVILTNTTPPNFPRQHTSFMREITRLIYMHHEQVLKSEH